MRISMPGLLLLAACASISVAKAQAPATLKISGTIVDDKSRLPLKGVSISAAGDEGAAPCVTDVDGVFILQLAPIVKAGDDVLIRFEKRAYEPMEKHVTASSGALALPFKMHHVSVPQTKPSAKQPNAETPLPRETHGTTDSVKATVQHPGAEDTTTAQVGHRKAGVLKLTFQDSASLTSARTERISSVLNDYYDYLTSEVGLELPKELPPIGVSPKGAVSLAGGMIGAPPYYSHIIISEDSIDNDDAVRSDYSFYIFQELLNVGPPDSPVRQFNSQALWIFTCHFASSFGGKKICSIDVSPAKWIDALWEMRQIYGKHYADKVLGFTLRMWATSSPGQWKDFDQFFMNKLLPGETVMNGDPARFNEVRELVKRYRIQID